MEPPPVRVPELEQIFFNLHNYWSRGVAGAFNKGWRRQIGRALIALAVASGGAFASRPRDAAPPPGARLLAPEFLVAVDRGLLLLSSRARDVLGVSLATVDFAGDDDCVSALPAVRWLLRFVGYDAAVLNAVIHATAGAGYVLAVHTGETHALSHAGEVRLFSQRGWGAWLVFRAGTLCSAVFLLFAASALVSFILAQTQRRMLRFTVALQQHVQGRLPLLPLVAAHLTDSLVFVPIMLGVLFFLFEFFADQLLAFMLLLVVWLCELWSISTCRTVGSIRFFPRLFGMLVTWFHVYYLSYPFGYQYVALGCVVAVLTAAVFHLWNAYELPALLDGSISARRLREETVSLLMRGVPLRLQAPAGAPTAAALGAHHLLAAMAETEMTHVVGEASPETLAAAAAAQ